MAALALGLLTVLVVPAAPGTARPARVPVAGSAAAVDYEAFRGEISAVRQRGDTWVYTATVDVAQVFGSARLRSEQATVVLDRAFTRGCNDDPRPPRKRRPGGFVAPFAAGDDVVVVGERLGPTTYSVAQCTQVNAATASWISRVVEAYGEPRAPRMNTDTGSTELPAVEYFCPDTREAISGPEGGDIEDAACVQPDDDPTLTRAAAPGAALVLAGLLGLFLARRLGRR